MIEIQHSHSKPSRSIISERCWTSCSAFFGFASPANKTCRYLLVIPSCSLLFGKDMEYSRVEVSLDTTLAELYAIDGQHDNAPITIVPCCWCSDLGYTKAIPKTMQYLYQGTPPPTTTEEVRELVIQCLSLESQRFSFVCGDMDVAMFDFEHRVGRLDAIKNLNVLPASQRLRISSFHGIKDLCDRKLEAQLAVVVPHEKLASHRQTTEPDVSYGLLSKRYLALSGLPTPPSSVLDLDDYPGSVEHKLSIASSWIHSFAISRVFKTQQGMSSVGTFIIRTDPNVKNWFVLCQRCCFAILCIA